MRPLRLALSLLFAAAVAVGCGAVLGTVDDDNDDDDTRTPDGAASGEPDASGTDGNGASDGGGGSDGPSATSDGAADGGLCGAGCVTGTTCMASGCHVDGEPSCPQDGGTAVIDVPLAGGNFYGRICAATSPAVQVCSGSDAKVPAHVFHFSGLGQYTLAFRITSGAMKTNVVDSVCVSPASKGCSTTAAGKTAVATVDGGASFAIAFDATTGCTDYVLQATPK